MVPARHRAGYASGLRAECCCCPPPGNNDGLYAVAEIAVLPLRLFGRAQQDVDDPGTVSRTAADCRGHGLVSPRRALWPGRGVPASRLRNIRMVYGPLRPIWRPKLGPGAFQ